METGEKTEINVDSLFEKFLEGEISGEETKLLEELIENDRSLVSRFNNAFAMDTLLRSVSFYQELREYPPSDETSYDAESKPLVRKSPKHGKLKRFLSSSTVCATLWCCLLLAFIVMNNGGKLGEARSRPEDMPSLHSCELVLAQDGKPLSNAVVSLQSLDPENHWVIGGRTDKNGTVKVWTHTFFEGVPSGEYSVVVTKFETVVPSAPQIIPEDPDELIEISNEIEMATRQFLLVEEKYTDVDTTPLKVKITEGSHHARFDLGKKIHVLHSDPANKHAKNNMSFINTKDESCSDMFRKS